MAQTPGRIAIVCDNASLKMGGEAAIPLRFFFEFRKLGVDVDLLTHERVKAHLEETLTAEELEAVHFFEDTAFQKAVFRWGRALPSRVQEISLGHLISWSTQMRQSDWLRRNIRSRGIDLVFVPTPISPRALSFIRCAGTPVFYGPLNGAMNYPEGFSAQEPAVSRALVAIGRRLSEPLHLLFSAKSKAAGVFLSNPRTLHGLPRAMRAVPRFKSFDATVDHARWGAVERSRVIEPDHFVYVGRLVDWKHVEFAVEAVHRLGGAARLTVIGDGPERPRLEALAARGLGVVAFRGYMPHAEMMAVFETATALVLPSLREAGGNVCLEALAAGVPVIAVNWGGARDVVLDGAEGLLVDPDGEEQLVAGFAAAMERMMDAPEMVRTMGEAGRARVLHAFSWEKKAKDYLSVFETALTTGYPRDPSQPPYEIHARTPEERRTYIAWPVE